MGSLIIEIQKDALNSTSSITALLRKAHVAAKKLSLKEFDEWIDLELNGYQNNFAIIPEYRTISCDLLGWNQFHGWQKVTYNCAEDERFFTIRKLSDPISVFERSKSDQSKAFQFNASPEITSHLNDINRYPTNYIFTFGATQGKRIIESVRNTILNWSLELEQQGILGENMSFNAEEKEKAASSTIINNFFHGDVNNSQIQQNSNHSPQTMNLEQNDIESINQLISLLNDNIHDLPVEKDNIDFIADQLNVISKEMQAEEPKRSIVSRCFSTIKDILVNVPASLIASGMITEIDKLGLF